MPDLEKTPGSEEVLLPSQITWWSQTRGFVEDHRGWVVALAVLFAWSGYSVFLTYSPVSLWLAAGMWVAASVAPLAFTIGVGGLARRNARRRDATLALSQIATRRLEDHTQRGSVSASQARTPTARGPALARVSERARAAFRSNLPPLTALGVLCLFFAGSISVAVGVRAVLVELLLGAALFALFASGVVLRGVIKPDHRAREELEASERIHRARATLDDSAQGGLTEAAGHDMKSSGGLSVSEEPGALTVAGD